MNKLDAHPFTPKSDQFQIFPAASPEILHHTVRRTWLFIAYSDERWLYYQFLLPRLYICLIKVWETIPLGLGVKGWAFNLPRTGLQGWHPVRDKSSHQRKKTRFRLDLWNLSNRGSRTGPRAGVSNCEVVTEVLRPDRLMSVCLSVQGKVEMTIELLTASQASMSPAGLGQEEPNQNPKLDPPKWVAPPFPFLR